MEKTAAKARKNSAIPVFQGMCSWLWSVLKAAAVKVGRTSFWKMAFLCLLLRLFVVYPLGAGAAVAIGCIWCYRNLGVLKTALLKGLHGLVKLLESQEQKQSQ